MVLFLLRSARRLHSSWPYETLDRYGAKQAYKASPKRSAKHIKRIMRAYIDPRISN